MTLSIERTVVVALLIAHGAAGCIAWAVPVSGVESRRDMAIWSDARDMGHGRMCECPGWASAMRTWFSFIPK